MNTKGYLINSLTDLGLRVFNYPFDSDIDYTDKSILDFGCNRGRLLYSLPDVNYSYTGVEIQKPFIDELESLYPAHDFVLFNQYHPSYNSHGDKELKLSTVLSEKYDIIIAWNVFTHCSYQYMLETLEDLKTMLKENGNIIFNLYSVEKLVSLSGVLKRNAIADNVDINTKTWLDSTLPFNEKMYWENTETILYDTETNDDIPKTQLFSAYNLSWIQENNPTWELVETKTNIWSFKI